MEVSTKTAITLYGIGGVVAIAGWVYPLLANYALGGVLVFGSLFNFFNS